MVENMKEQREELMKLIFHTPVSSYDNRTYEELIADLVLASGYRKHTNTTADVEEVKHGEWNDRYCNKYDNHLYECSVCGEKALYEFYKNDLDNWEERQKLTPICPHCGAKMDGGNAE